MKRQTTIRQYTAPELDLTAIRKIAGNDNLGESEVFNFPTFVICRSGKNHNATDITGEGQRAAVESWIGKAIYYEDHDTVAKNQIGRIYQTWVEEQDGETVTYGKGFGVRTADHADLFKRIENRVHSEMSCAYEPETSLCSDCKSEIDLTSNRCSNGHAVGVDETYALDTKFQPDHISFVGRGAVEGAGLVAAASMASNLRAFMEDQKCLNPDLVKGVDPELVTQLSRLMTAAEDGREYRRYAEGEFIKWYGLANSDATNEEIQALSAKLTAKEMIRLGDIEMKKFREVIPDSGQLTRAPEQKDDDVEDMPLPEFQSVNDIYEKRGK